MNAGLFFTWGGRLTTPGFLVRCALLGTALAMAGCGRAPIALTPGYPSKDAAVQAFLTAVATRDRASLEALTVNEREFRRDIWPALPASEANVGMPPDYVWTETAQKNAGYLAQLLAEHGGTQYTLRVTTFAGHTSDYGAFRVHRKTVLDLRGPEGPVTVRLFGSMVESGGRWKIYSLVVD